MAKATNLTDLRGGNHGEIAAIDVVRKAMADKGLSFDGDRRTRTEFARRITMQLNGMARQGKITKLGFGRSVRWRLRD